MSDLSKKIESINKQWIDFIDSDGFIRNSSDAQRSRIKEIVNHVELTCGTNKVFPPTTYLFEDEVHLTWVTKNYNTDNKYSYMNIEIYQDGSYTWFFKDTIANIRNGCEDMINDSTEYIVEHHMRYFIEKDQI